MKKNKYILLNLVILTICGGCASTQPNRHTTVDFRYVKALSLDEFASLLTLFGDTVPDHATHPTLPPALYVGGIIKALDTDELAFMASLFDNVDPSHIVKTSQFGMMDIPKGFYFSMMDSSVYVLVRGGVYVERYEFSGALNRGRRLAWRRSVWREHPDWKKECVEKEIWIDRDNADKLSEIFMPFNSEAEKERFQEIYTAGEEDSLKFGLFPDEK